MLLKKLFEKIALVLATVFVLCAFAGISVSAAESSDAGEYKSEFKMQYLEITYPSDTVVLSKDTPATDEAWAKAGINNVSERKKAFQNNNIAQVYVDSVTKAIVYYITTNSTESFEAFDISEWDDEKVKQFAGSLYGVENLTAETKVEFGVYKHPETKFFTIDMVEDGEVSGHSLIYATVINGMLIEFFINNESLGGVNQEYIEKIVDGVHFTKKMTYQEYEESMAKTWRAIIIFIVAVIVVIIALVILSKYFKNYRKKRNEMLGQRLVAFRNKKQNGEIDIKTIIMEMNSLYDKELINTYVNFNTWFKPIIKNLIWGLVFAVIIVLAIQSGTSLAIVVGVAIFISLLYYMYSKSEKYKESLYKQYYVTQKKTATFRFYKDYFTMSGIDSITEFIYEQITSVRTFKGYLYLYMSDTYAVIIDMDEQPVEQLKNLIKMIKEKSKA